MSTERNPDGRLDRLRAYFGTGWLFLLPYTACYIVWLECSGSSVSLLRAFYGLHVAHAAGLARLAWADRDWRSGRRLLFWAVLAGFFVLIGVNLEFPGDPWEHYKRIFEWQRLERIAGFSAPYKSTYFLGWSLVGWAGMAWRRAALTAYAALWCLLVAYQVYRLALALGFSRQLARVQVVGSMLMLGTSYFSFYRYYALSSTPMAYVASLGLLVALVQASLGGRPRRLWLVPLAAVLVLFSHVQGFLFLAPCGLALGLHLAWTRLPERRTSLLLAGGLLLVLGFAFGWLVMRHPLPLLGLGDWLSRECPDMSALGTYRVWSEITRIPSTLGVLGWGGFVVALALARRRPLVALLTLMPLALLLFPPSALALRALYHALSLERETIYRIFYAFPCSFAYVAALDEGLASLRRTCRLPAVLRLEPAVLVLLALVLMAGLMRAPFYGRLWDLARVPDRMNSLAFTDQTVAALEARFAAAGSRPAFYCDCATGVAIDSNWGGGGSVLPYLCRLEVMEPLYFSDSQSLQGWTEEISGNLGRHMAFLLVAPEAVLDARYSVMGGASEHWSPRALLDNLWMSQDVARTLDPLLREAGWTKTVIPPFYLLYEDGRK